MSNEDRANNGFECPVCGDTFDTEEDLNEHVTNIHPD
ncbi:C2H2-type zinc finger protein [Haloarcula amylovorans]